MVVNGRFLAAEFTGVHRVASELLRQAFMLLGSDPALSERLELALWTPRRGARQADALALPFRIIGPLEGIAWEQFTLPLRAQHRTILSLCNVGPIATNNAVTMLQDAQVHITPASYSRWFRAWYRLNQPIVGKRHRRILTVSDFSREQLALHGVARKEKIVTIPNGADHALRVSPDLNALDRLRLSPQAYVVALANTQPHKNIPLLLQAFSHSDLSHLTLVLFGAARRSHFEAMGHHVPGNTCFAGRVTDRELWALYGNACCLAFPSLTEGFGLPPLEAMLLGCPAIVAPAGALPETCGKAALYADPGDVHAWRAAILSLSTDAARRDALVAQGRAWASGFTWRNAASLLLAELAALPAPPD